MKKTLFSIAAFLLSIYAYCQDRYMYAYSRIIPEKYVNTTGELDVNSNNNLVLYLGKDTFDIYPEVWNPNNKIIIRNGERDTLKQRDLKLFDYLLFNKIGKQYSITIRGGEYNVIFCKPTKKAEKFFEKNANPSHTSHTSHFSAYHGSHSSHSSHSSHYSSY